MVFFCVWILRQGRATLGLYFIDTWSAFPPSIRIKFETHFFREIYSNLPPRAIFFHFVSRPHVSEPPGKPVEAFSRNVLRKTPKSDSEQYKIFLYRFDPVLSDVRRNGNIQWTLSGIGCPIKLFSNGRLMVRVEIVICHKNKFCFFFVTQSLEFPAGINDIFLEKHNSLKTVTN